MPSPGPDAAVDQLLDRRRSATAGHLARRGERHRGSRGGEGVEILSVELGAVGDHDAGTQHAPSSQSSDRAGRLRAGVDVDGDAQLPRDRTFGGYSVRVRRPELVPEGDGGGGTGRIGKASQEPARLCSILLPTPRRPVGDLDEHGAQSRVRVGLERGLLRLHLGGDIGPVNDCGDARFRRPQEGDQRGGVNVIGSEMASEGGDKDGGVGARSALTEVPEQGPPGVAVGVNEAGHDDGVRGVDQLRVPGPDPGPDLGYDSILDEDIGPGVVGGLGPQREDTAAAQKDPRCHSRPPHNGRNAPHGLEAIHPPSYERPIPFSNTTHNAAGLPRGIAR